MIWKYLSILLLSVLFCGMMSGQIVVPTTNGYEIIDDFDGEPITKHSYPFIDEPSGDLCLFYNNGFFGYHHKNGNIQISNRFDIAYPFKQDFALVGKRNKYCYINENGDTFGELDWPQAPITYKEFLILEDSISQVFHKDGEKVLETTHQLIATPQSGIMEWNQDSGWVKQHISSPKYGEIREANHFENVTNVATTWQGYACVEFDSVFSIYNNRGEARFTNQPSQNYYLPVKVVWNNYLFLPNQHSSARFENEIHSEPLYYADEMFRADGRNVYGPSVLLGEGFMEEDVALLRGTEKWVVFEGQKINGSYLFDEVLPSDQRGLLLVRQNMEWKIYSERLDSLISTGYRYVHHRGLVNGLFFGSNDNQPYEKKNWSINVALFQHGDLNISFSGEQVYQFPHAYYRNGKVANPQVFQNTESKDCLMLLKEGKAMVLNENGEDIYQFDSNLGSQISLEDLFMPNLFLDGLHVEQLHKQKGVKQNSIGIYLEVENQSLEILIANTTKEDFNQVIYGWVQNDSNINNGLIEVYLEYQKQNGDWQKITRFPGGGMSDNLNRIKIPPNHLIRGAIDLSKGPVGADYNVRANFNNSKGETVYSNTVKMSLAPALRYGQPYHKKYGAVSKYQLLEQ